MSKLDNSENDSDDSDDSDDSEDSEDLYNKDSNIKNDIIKRVKYYTQECPEDINKKTGKCGETVLHDACDKNMMDQVKILLECEKLDPNTQDDDKMTALHIAIFDNNPNYSYEKCRKYNYGMLRMPSDPNLIRLLLEDERIDPNIKDAKNRTSFQLACAHEYMTVDIIKLFLDDSRVDVKYCNSYKLTPLMIACKARNYEIVKELLNDPRFDVNERDDEGRTAFYHACETASQESKIIKLLLDDERIDPNILDIRDNAPIIAALRYNWHIIDLLLENGKIKCHKNDKIISYIKKEFDVQLNVVKQLFKIFGRDVMDNMLNIK